MSELRFDGKVVLVTGAGGGLGRAHALLFGRRGAKVVVNDVGASLTGGDPSESPAQQVVEELRAAGGEAVANYDSVSEQDGAARMVAAALESFGRLDVVVNNAGILRDKSFLKMTEDDFDAVLAVHLKGAFNVTKAAWPHLREQGYGRIVMTSSAAGLYGNFGQANYSAAKAALMGLGRTLAQEGAKYGIHTNVVAPVARSRMTETMMPPELLARLDPEQVSPLVVWLCAETCPANGEIYEVGAGRVYRLEWTRSGPLSAQPLTPELLRDGWDSLADMSTATVCPGLRESMASFLA